MTTASTAAPAAETDALPFTLPLELNVTDPDVIRELWSKREGRERDEYALAALRLGTLALRQARGEIDAHSIRREGDRLMREVATALVEHRQRIDTTLSQTLQEYFDPESGRFSERVERLVKQDGELEVILARQITSEDSAMSRALAAHVGQESPLFKLLSPNESAGLLNALKESVAKELEDQRIHVLREFSLDNKEGALAKLTTELSDSNGKLTEGLQGKIDEIIKQFSFDDEQSAISRMRQTVDTTKETISKHLNLNEPESALSRIRRELMDVLKQHAEGTQKFQEEVRVALESMQVRRREAARSTTHGHDFEAEVFAYVTADAQRKGDIAESTGNSTGVIKNCKKGDIVVQLGPECAASGARLVIEAKEDRSFDLAKARAELDEARRNRCAEIGLFVFSGKTAPAGLEPVARYGDDLIVIWDAEDTASDLHLSLALSVARAFCTRRELQRAKVAVDFGELDEALANIEKQLGKLDEVGSSAEAIKKHSEKILDRLRISREKLAKDAAKLAGAIADLRQHVPEAAS